MTATNICYNFVGFRYSPPLEHIFSTASHLTIIKKTLQKFLMVGTIFNLDKVNTVPCMFTATLSLR